MEAEDVLDGLVDDPVDQLVLVPIVLVHCQLAFLAGLDAARLRSETRGMIHASPLTRARRSALETTFSRFAIDIRTETPDCWFTCGEVRRGARSPR